MADGSVVEETSTPIPETKTGSVTIKTNPPGATVWIEGKRRGTSPVNLTQLKPGRIRVKASKEGYETVEEQVWVRAGKASQATLLLEKTVVMGGIEIRSTPAGAKWYLDGAYAGTTPDTMANVEKGGHRIEVIKPGYQPWSRSIEIKVGKTTRLNARLQAEKVEYALTVDTEPQDARVRILNIGPRYYAGIRLKPGRYHVEVSGEGYETHKEWVEIADADRDVDVTLRRRHASGASMTASREWVDPTTGMEFVRVPGGCFRKDSYGGPPTGKPVHQVCVDGFWMGKYEVTQGQWKALKRYNPSRFKNGDNYPVERVSWNDTQEFIRKLNAKGQGGFRLPTEAEWEYACRSGGKQEEYCGGNDLNRVAWYSKNSGKQTHAVGKKAGNGLGLYDMSGNVWEWVGDWYDGTYYRKSPKNNPKGPGQGTERVIRGGSWFDNPFFASAAIREGRAPGGGYRDTGFRLVRIAP